MATDTTATYHAAGYTARPVTKAPAWHGLVAWDLLLNNLATGLFLTEALGELTAPVVFGPLTKWAYPLALVLLTVDLLFLVLDLGDPLRFHHMLRTFKPSSPMSLGTWCLTVYSFPLAIAAALSLLSWDGFENRPTEWIRKAAVILAILPALGSAVYKGILLSTNAQPGWRDARWLGGYLTSSAFTLGCAALLAVSVLLGQQRATALLRPALVVLLVLNAFFLFLLFAELRPAAGHRWTARQLLPLGVLILGGGMFAPLCLLLIGNSAAVLLAAVLLFLLGSVVVRSVIIKIPHANGEASGAASIRRC